jgi:hypothetical protein
VPVRCKERDAMKKCTLSVVTVLASALLSCGAAAARAQQPTPRTIDFSGYTWEVRQPGNGGPGPNDWDPANVFVDAQGRLHLRITQTTVPGDGVTAPQVVRRCAEITTVQRLGLGRYEFQVTGPIDELNENVVLGLFDYPTRDVGINGTNEIDIEFGKWGRPAANNGNFTVYHANDTPGGHDTHTFRFLHDDSASEPITTTESFTRYADRIVYACALGGRETGGRTVETWTYAPTNRDLLPMKPLPVHVNLWLFQGRPPSDGKPVEIVIDHFAFVPEPEQR